MGLSWSADSFGWGDVRWGGDFIEALGGRQSMNAIIEGIKSVHVCNLWVQKG